MKKIIFIIVVSFIAITSIFSQAKKPTIMVVPSDLWCIERGFFNNVENQGKTEKVMDYKSAFQENSELLLVISTINGMMAERGFPLKNLETELKKIENQSAEDNMRTSSRTGAAVNKSTLDIVKETAKADITVQLTWTINATGPKKSITFNMQGLDNYSAKQIATAVGTGAQSFSSELPVLLTEAVNSHIDAFTNSLQTHFDDLFENGREIIVLVKVWDDWDEDMLTEFGEDDLELGEIIQSWIDENTVKGRNNLSKESENMLYFEQVRIPLYYKYKESEKAMDAKMFGSNLRSYLKDNFDLESLRESDGLGKVTLYIGHK